MEEVIFGLILHAGNARSASMEAIQFAKEKKFTEAHEKLKEAGDNLGEAHKTQTSLIQGEIRGEKTDISLLLIHAQDHLMTAMAFKELAAEIIYLHENK